MPQFFQIENKRKVRDTFNVPGRKNAVHLGPKGDPSALSPVLEKHSEHGYGPEIDRAKRARHIDVRDVAATPPAPAPDPVPEEKVEEPAEKKSADKQPDGAKPAAKKRAE